MASDRATVVPATPTTPTIQIDDQGYEIDPSGYGETQSLRSQPSFWSRRQNGVHHHQQQHHHQSNGSTINGSTNDLPILQEINPLEESEEYDPVNEDSFSYDLVAPYEGDAAPRHSLERQADLMFSAKHMLTILTTPRYLAHFREFPAEERPKSLAMLDLLSQREQGAQGHPVYECARAAVDRCAYAGDQE